MKKGEKIGADFTFFFLAIATAEAAGAGPTSDSSCGRMALLYATAYSPSDASAAGGFLFFLDPPKIVISAHHGRFWTLAVNSHAAALAIKAELAAAVVSFFFLSLLRSSPLSNPVKIPIDSCRCCRCSRRRCRCSLSAYHPLEHRQVSRSSRNKPSPN